MMTYDEQWSDAAHLERMRAGWGCGGPETPCGGGSTMAQTTNLRPWLLSALRHYGITSLADAGAGDLNWVRHIATEFTGMYRAFDLYPRHPDVIRWDITKLPLPHFDAILCRDVLIHFDPPRIEKTLKLFRESQAKYLFATQYDIAKPFAWMSGFNYTNLRPYLGDYLEAYEEAPKGWGCQLAVWRLNQ